MFLAPQSAHKVGLDTATIGHGSWMMCFASIKAVTPSNKALAAVQAAFFSKMLAAASGRWIDGPQALLSGFVNGNASNIILQLNA